jgi:hypothetical protein
LITVRAQTVINFDAIPGMSNSPGAAIPVASQISNQFAASGVLFSSGSGAGLIAAVNLGVNHATSGAIGVGGATLNTTLTYSGDPLLVARFVNPADGLTPFVTNFVSVRGDLIGVGGTITIRGFSIANALLGTFSAPDANGTLLSLSVPNIHRVEITGTGNVAYDDFTFNAPTAPIAAAAPEPGSLALLALTGLPVVGAVVRRRRTA